MGAPKNTPKEIIEKLNKEINAVLAEPAIKARLVDLGGEPLIGAPDAFGAMIVAETEKMGESGQGRRRARGIEVRPEHSSAELFEPEATQAAPTQEGEQIMRNTMLATLLLVAGAATMAGSGPAAAAIDYPYCIQGKGVGHSGRLFLPVLC